MVSSIGNIGLGSGGTPEAGPTGGELGKQEFLRLLTTQLQQQDPLNPQDGTEFVAQLAQFTSLERLVNLEQGLDNVAAASLASNSTQAASLIGKSVRVEGDSFRTGPGASSQVNYTLDGPADKVTIEIMDESGKVVDTIETNGRNGLNQHTWDAAIDKDGQPIRLPAGEYRFKVTAEQDGETVSAKTWSIQKIDAVTFKDFTPVLVLENGDERALGEVIEVMDGDRTTPRPGDDE